ncbi:WD repeat-containing protein 48-like isoform X2 [Dreissena polymorpha]|nr:WD repeat-containing protein 48-like isoform X2 [Dreissena polymorpha]XP_052250142.1 WD repeat-containing protein 48-like isoform X2 [Dreissena polymorpha]XP_052250143.1 WD repeat-containing protein 48-like isoform X2 [Dreissena polymorpha]XP_052250144.1 WD repeat-containing protein 48-like isoform X2 [Dreissena polymorpha]XP_052250145.1 WD repeat-containing protein 48-like isoform X2 [Dreissena polymorpha]
MNPWGTVIVSGSTEKVLRVWDPRTCVKMMKLKGHTDNVKAVVLNRDGSQCLSGGSDGMIRLWSLGQQRCIATFRVHDEGVWALQANESFSMVYSAGRDCRVWATDIRNTDYRCCVCEEKEPVLKLELTTAETPALWVSTTNSSIKCYNVKSVSKHLQSSLDNVSVPPVCSQPEFTIKGGSSIRQYHVLNDRRHIITKDTEDSVAVWDVLMAQKVEDLGKKDYEEEIKNRFKIVYVPNWFSVDLKTGMLTIHLEETDCFTAWVSAKELGITLAPEEAETKLNVGKQLLQALLDSWPRTHVFDMQQAELKNGNESDTHPGPFFQVPGHTPLIFSEVGRGKTLFRLLCRDAGGDTEQMLLNENVPQWVVEVLVHNNVPKSNKIPFFLQPHQSLGQKVVMKKDRLSANDMIQVRKVIEHVYEKVLGQGSDAGSQAPSSGGGPSGDKADEGEDISAIAEEKVELLCNDQVLNPSMDLRTVKHFIWKQGGDLTLHYRPLK